MASYDPQILQRFADRLYARAAALWLLYGAIGAAVGGLLGFGLAKYLEFPMFLVVTAIGGGVVGAIIGYERAFTLRLEAQRTLCVLQTEINTRRVEVDQPVKPASPE